MATGERLIRKPLGVAADLRREPTLGRSASAPATGRLRVGADDDPAEPDANTMARLVQRALDTTLCVAPPTASARIQPGPVLRRKMAFGAKDLNGKLSTKAALKQMVGGRESTWHEISRYLKQYETAKTPAAELRTLQVLEMLAKEWLADHGSSPTTNDKDKAASLQQLVRACETEINTLGAVQDADYTRRIGVTNAKLGGPPGAAGATKAQPKVPSKAPHDGSFRYISGSGIKGVQADPSAVQTDPQFAGRNLSAAEIAAIRVYSGGDYRTINPTLENSNSWLAGQTEQLTQTAANTSELAKNPKAKGKGKEGGWANPSTKKAFDAADGKATRHQRREIKVEAMQHARMATSGLQKLQWVSGDGFRGMTMTKAALDAQYSKGSVITYKPFISTSLNRMMSAGYAKLAKDPEVGVLLLLDITHGHDVDQISLAKGEKEILLMPGASFTVGSPPRFEGGVWIVEMKQTGVGSGAEPGASVPIKLNDAAPGAQAVKPAASAAVPPPAPALAPTGSPSTAAGPSPAPPQSASAVPTRPRSPSRLAADLATPAKAADPAALLRDEAISAAQVLIARAQRAEPGVTTALTDIAKRNSATLEGLAHRLKTEASLARKLVDRSRTRVVGGDYADAVAAEAAKCNDVLRYTMQIPDKTYSNADTAIRAELPKAGFQLRNYWNAWKETTGAAEYYKGINITFATRDGQLFELQLHTKKSLQTKQEIHGLYRSTDTDPGRRAAAGATMKQKWAKVSAPKGMAPSPVAKK